MNIEPINVLTLLGMLGMAITWIYQRYIDRREQAQQRIVAARAEQERKAEEQLERIRLIRDIENESIANLKAELADLRAQLREERDARTQMQEELDKLRQENRMLRMYGRPEDQVRITELEARVAHLEAERDAPKGDK